MTNALRNETVLEVGATSYKMRPTFAAMAEIESKTNKSMLELTESVVQRSMTIAQTIAIIEEGTKAAGEPLNKSDIIQLIEDYGILPLQHGLSEFLTIALYGGEKFEEDSKKK